MCRTEQNGRGETRPSVRLGRQDAPALLQRQRQSAQIQADDQAVLFADERQHGAALVGEDDGLRALEGGGAGAGLGVDADDVGRAADVADGAMEVRLRGAEGEAVAQAADRQRIAVALERQHAAAGRAADDEPGLEDADADRAARRRAQPTPRRDSAARARRPALNPDKTCIRFLGSPSHQRRHGAWTIRHCTSAP